MPPTNGTNDKAESSGSGAPVTKEKILALDKQLKQRYDDRNKDIVDLLKLYDEPGVWQDVEDEEVYRVVVPDGQSAIDLVCDMISGQRINLIVPAAVDKATEKKNAETVRSFLQTWHQMMEREEDVNLSRELAQDACKLGAACVRVIVDDERIPGKDEPPKPWETFPLIPEIRDYSNIYPLFRRQRLTAVIDSYQVSVLDAKLDYPEITWPKDWKDDSEITLNEYWSDTHKAFWVDGKRYSPKGTHTKDDAQRGIVWLQAPVVHKYGRLPYSIRFLRGEGKYRNQPEKQSRSFLKSWGGTLRVMNAIESAKLTTGLGYVNGAWAVTTRRQQGAFKLDLRSNKVNYLMPDETVTSLARGQVPVDLMGMSTEWREKLQRQSVPDAVYGEGLAHNMAGYAIALQGESGRRILQPSTQAVQHALADMFSIAICIIEEYLGPLYKERELDLLVHTYERKGEHEVPFRKEVSLDYSIIEGLRYTEVEIGNPMPQDDERAVRLAVQLRAPDETGTPLASDETILEKVLKYDSRQERVRIERQKFRALIYQQVTAELMEELGIGQAGDEQGDLMEMVDQRLAQVEGAIQQIMQEHEAMMAAAEAPGGMNGDEPLIAGGDVIPPGLGGGGGGLGGPGDLAGDGGLGELLAAGGGGPGPGVPPALAEGVPPEVAPVEEVPPVG